MSDDACPTDVVSSGRPSPTTQKAALTAFGEQWGLGGVPGRVIEALG